MKKPAKSPNSRSKPVKATPAKTKPAATKTHRSLCPINLALEAIGDNWSMLIVRDLMLRGHNSYQGFLRSEEKIATNILADRLVKLEQNGLITKSADPSDKRKFIYALTERGADLAPLLVEMALYGLKYEPLANMAKEVVLDMQKNKQTFAQRLTRNFTPKTKIKTAPKKADLDPVEETLSLF
ncbi:helix-turn-helix domain-containing protein [Asticcacaulis sp. 201]|uniref:winged helix-turn-helix transcriptional regulator n=1 Tax=Asticcacaulis sp. 201 TaxID=3028787 RepID=UPI002916595D|nr:helix-turn-helix domain-containing protein [Asticcacaulis sp. 201]MDV6329370.1 helix-turn-helix domain-containing protein [Asticcacaulis sp. 201]